MTSKAIVVQASFEKKGIVPSLPRQRDSLGGGIDCKRPVAYFGGLYAEWGYWTSTFLNNVGIQYSSNIPLPPRPRFVCSNGRSSVNRRRKLTRLYTKNQQHTRRIGAETGSNVHAD